MENLDITLTVGSPNTVPASLEYYTKEQIDAKFAALDIHSVFVAEYGVTEYADVVDAAENRTVLCKRNNEYYLLFKLDSTKAVFTAIDGFNVITVTLDSSDVWQYDSESIEVEDGSITWAKLDEQLAERVAGAVDSSEIADDLTTDNPDMVLSAKQGKVLKDALDNLDSAKQDVLTAGDNIVIENNVISATAEHLEAGTGIQISDNVISAKINNTLTSTATDYALSANQGKILNEKIETIELNQDVKKILATEDDLDGEGLEVDDTVKVLKDGTQADATTIYTFNGSTFDYVGKVGAYYTKAETDILIEEKIDDNIIDDLATNDATKTLSARQGKGIGGVLGYEYYNEEDLEYERGGAVLVPSSGTLFTGDTATYVYVASCLNVNVIKLIAYSHTTTGCITFFNSDDTFELDNIVGSVEYRTGYNDMSVEVPDGAVTVCFYNYNEFFIGLSIKGIRYTKKSGIIIDAQTTQGGNVYVPSTNTFFAGSNEIKIWKLGVENAKIVKVTNNNYDSLGAITFFNSYYTFNASTMVNYQLVNVGIQTTEIEVPEGSIVCCFANYNNYDYTATIDTTDIVKALPLNITAAKKEDLEYKGYSKNAQFQLGGAVLTINGTYFIGDQTWDVYKIDTTDDVTKLSINVQTTNDEGFISFFNSDSVFNDTTLVGTSRNLVGTWTKVVDVPEGAVTCCFASVKTYKPLVNKIYYNYKQYSERLGYAADSGAVYVIERPGIPAFFFTGDRYNTVNKINVQDKKYIRIKSKTIDTLGAISFFTSSTDFTMSTFIQPYELQPLGVFDEIYKVPYGAVCLCVVCTTDYNDFEVFSVGELKLTQLSEQVSYLSEKIDSKTTTESNKVYAAVNDALPTNAKVYIESDLLTVVKDSEGNPTNEITPLTTSKNVVGDVDEDLVKLTFESDTINFSDWIEISYQGQSSLTRPKKGFSIDLRKKHRFGNWLKFDGFHLKGYWSDWLHNRDIIANRIYEQMLNARVIEERRPFMFNNNFDVDNTGILVEGGAKCHIDGFPVELYINGTYWGLYSWNIKKDRANYKLSKNDTDHIQVDVAVWRNGVSWTGVEFRNPKGLIDINGNPYDGDNPKELAAGPVKDAWVRLNTFIWSTFTSSTSKDTIEEYINVKDFIDTYLLYQFGCDWDIWQRNTLYTTWDSSHWSPLPYDMDAYFGIGVNHSTETDYVGGDIVIPSNTNELEYYYNSYPWVKYMANIYSVDIANRYAELRNSGVFTAENVKNLLNQWTQNVGQNIYDDDAERWSYPSFGGSDEDFYESTERIVKWFVERISYMDNLYNYK